MACAADARLAEHLSAEDVFGADVAALAAEQVVLQPFQRQQVDEFGHRGGHARPTDVFERGFGQVRIAQDLGEQAASDVFAGMDRNNGGASVRVLQVMMAAARSDRFETQPFQRPDQLATGDAGQSGVRGDADARTR